MHALAHAARVQLRVVGAHHDALAIVPTRMVLVAMATLCLNVLLSAPRLYAVGEAPHTHHSNKATETKPELGRWTTPVKYPLSLRSLSGPMEPGPLTRCIRVAGFRRVAAHDSEIDSS